MYTIPFKTQDDVPQHIKPFIDKWGIHFRVPEEEDIFIVEFSNQLLQLRKLDEPSLGAVYVDFITGPIGYRRRMGGGKQQAIARAVGLKKGIRPTVVDATAGFGRDAFILASMGCRVHMIERSPVIAVLLADGLYRAQNDPKIGEWVLNLLSLSNEDSTSALESLPFCPDVIYLDPLFPEKKKSALVKKEMRVLRALLGADKNNDTLLQKALTAAKKRIVVKRPEYANWLNNIEPNTSIKTQKYRFDLYDKI